MVEETAFEVHDDVVAVAGAHGIVCDVSEMSNGETVYGVKDLNGAVRYYTKDAIKKVL